MEYNPYSRNPYIWDLMYVKQLPNETAHHYWDRFLLVKNGMAPCRHEEIIKAFQFNYRDEGVLNALACRRIQSFIKLLDMVRKYCTMESTWREQ